MMFEIRHEPNGTVDLAFDGVTLLGASSSGTEDVLSYVAIRMTKEDFESLASAMTTTRVRELHCSLDDTLKLVVALRDERDELKRSLGEADAKAELWKNLAERQDNTGPLRRELLLVKSERDELKRHVDYLKYQVDALPTSDDADELRDVIVSQAREIARLKGESE